MISLFLLEVAPTPQNRVFAVFTTEERAEQAAEVAKAFGAVYIGVTTLEVDDFWAFQKSLKANTEGGGSQEDSVQSESKFLGEIE
jgi:hypothetical protein